MRRRGGRPLFITLGEFPSAVWTFGKIAVFGLWHQTVIKARLQHQDVTMYDRALHSGVASIVSRSEETRTSFSVNDHVVGMRHQFRFHLTSRS